MNHSVSNWKAIAQKEEWKINQGNLGILCQSGNGRGVFIWIDKNGFASAGFYGKSQNGKSQNGIQYIPIHSRKFESKDEAIEKVFPGLGVGHLVDQLEN